jgi:NADPH:quinone reductase-like Zn-dependent oxidoreductase
MRAVHLHEFGPPENLVLEEVPDLHPGPGQLRLAVEASGAHFVDTTIRSGAPGGPFEPPILPHVPGREVAGVVDELGAGVGDEWLGRRVVGHLGAASGGYAEQAVIAASAVHPVPDGVPSTHAVAMIGTGRTAVGVLRLAELTPTDTVAVLAAGGGMGALLVQHARRRGLRVIGAAGGPAKTELVRSLGVTVAVDYDDPRWTEHVERELGARPATILLDGVGGERSTAAVGLLADGGRRLVYGWSSGEEAPLAPADEARGVRSTVVLGPMLLDVPGGMRTLETQSLAALAAGELTPLVTTFPLAEAAAAHRALESRATTGKVVLVPEHPA